MPNSITDTLIFGGEKWDRTTKQLSFHSFSKRCRDHRGLLSNLTFQSGGSRRARSPNRLRFHWFSRPGLWPTQSFNFLNWYPGRDSNSQRTESKSAAYANSTTWALIFFSLITIGMTENCSWIFCIYSIHGENKSPPFIIIIGVTNRHRTGVFLDHNQELYQLSYGHTIND